AACSEANAFHVEVQIADDGLLFFRMGVEPRVRSADLLDPLEIDRALRTRQLAFGDQLQIRTAYFESEGTARVVVISPLLDVSLEQVSADSDFLRGAAVARNLGMNDLLLVRNAFAFGNGADHYFLAAIERRFQISRRFRRKSPGCGVGLCGDGGRHNFVRIVDRTIAFADGADAQRADGPGSDGAIVESRQASR